MSRDKNNEGARGNDPFGGRRVAKKSDNVPDFGPLSKIKSLESEYSDSSGSSGSSCTTRGTYGSNPSSQSTWPPSSSSSSSIMSVSSGEESRQAGAGPSTASPQSAVKLTSSSLARFNDQFGRRRVAKKSTTLPEFGPLSKITSLESEYSDSSRSSGSSRTTIDTNPSLPSTVSISSASSSDSGSTDVNNQQEEPQAGTSNTARLATSSVGVHNVSGQSRVAIKSKNFPVVKGGGVYSLTCSSTESSSD